MRVTKMFGATLAIAASIWVISSPAARAIRLSDGTVSFEKAPDLVTVTSTFHDVNVWGATYFFILSLPQNAGEPLQKVTIAQIEGLEDLRFNLKETYAVEGTGWNRGEKVTLGEVTTDNQTQTISVTFNPPVSPGKTIAIALRPVRNPSADGIYLFGIKAFPAGAKSSGIYLGTGRLHFYSTY